MTKQEFDLLQTGDLLFIKSGEYKGIEFTFLGYRFNNKIVWGSLLIDYKIVMIVRR